MNKLCITKKGVELLNEETQELELQSNYKTLFTQTKRTASLPQLISKANFIEKQEINNRLSKLTLRMKDLKQRGLKKIIIDQEDAKLKTILQQQFSTRKHYLQSIVPTIVKKTRDNNHFGNLPSRVERCRAYLDRLQHNFDNKFVFKPPVQLEED